MNAEEKAIELVNRFVNTRLTISTTMDSIPTRLSDYPDEKTAKKLALILTDELVDDSTCDGRLESMNYWKEVREKINSL